MANEGQTLINVYQAYLKQRATPTHLAAQFPMLQFQGNSVGRRRQRDRATSTRSSTSLKQPGVPGHDGERRRTAIVEGYVPIASLPAIAQLPQDARRLADRQAGPSASSASPTTRPSTALQADVARQQFGVDGTGVTVGVLSDSVSQFAGGLADSVKTGDLPDPNVKVIQDGPRRAATDEGRAMLENIHDIAPGAALAFATADGGELGFANNIQALGDRPAPRSIVDDVGYPTSRSSRTASSRRRSTRSSARATTYFSAAGNDGRTRATCRASAASTATVGTLGAGTLHELRPRRGGAVTQLPITIDGASATNPAILIFQFDQPFATQEPAGQHRGVDVGGRLLRPRRSRQRRRLGQRTTTSRPAQPFQDVDITAPGSYTVVDPGRQRARPRATSSSSNFERERQRHGLAAVRHGRRPAARTTRRRSATTRPPTRSASAPCPGGRPPPYLNQHPLELRAVQLVRPGAQRLQPRRHAQGDARPGAEPGRLGPRRRQHVVLRARPDHRHEPAPVPGRAGDADEPLAEPARASSARRRRRPNVAAVAALMQQKTPTLTPAQIRARPDRRAPRRSTAPPPGTWNPQGGFGLVNAVNGAQRRRRPHASSSTTPGQRRDGHARPRRRSTSRSTGRSTSARSPRPTWSSRRSRRA